MGSILDSLGGSMGGVGMGLSAVGGVLKMFGAAGQAKEARRQGERANVFGVQQTNRFNVGYDKLEEQARALPTFTADMSQYNRLESQAAMNERLASGGRLAGENIYQDKLAQASANAMAGAKLGARSGTDLITAALLTQNQESEGLLSQQATSQQMRQQILNQAKQNTYNSMAQTASGYAQQRGMEFESQLNKQKGIMGVGQSRLESGLNLEQQIFAGQQAAAGALADAKAAMWGAGGDILGGFGSGLAASARADKSFQNYMTMSGLKKNFIDIPAPV